MSKKELWEACGCFVYLPNNKGGFSLSECPDSEGYARRIVACLNILADQPVELIERSTITIPGTTYQDLIEQRNQLLSALKSARVYVVKHINTKQSEFDDPSSSGYDSGAVYEEIEVANRVLAAIDFTIATSIGEKL